MSRRPSLTDFDRKGGWTPSIGDASLDGSGEGQAYSRQVGRWTKTGNLLTFSGQVEISDLGTLTTAETAHILGLPYSALSTANTQSAISVGFADSLALSNTGESVAGFVVPGTKNIQLQLCDATTGTTDMTVAELSAGGRLIFSGHYVLGES